MFSTSGADRTKAQSMCDYIATLTPDGGTWAVARRVPSDSPIVADRDRYFTILVQVEREREWDYLEAKLLTYADYDPNERRTFTVSEYKELMEFPR